MKTTIVIPTYNEASNVPKLVKEIFDLGIEGIHILVVDDNSPDGTGQVAEDLAKEYPGRVGVIHREGKLGLATAYLTGFARALKEKSDYICEMDADFSHQPSYLPQFLDKLKDYDVAVGSRYTKGGSVDPTWGFGRKVMSGLGNFYARLITGMKVKETTGGFKCFRRKVLESLDFSRIRSRGYAFQMEVAYACEKLGFRVVEVPILFRERAMGQSKMSWAIFWEALWLPWKIRFSKPWKPLKRQS